MEKECRNCGEMQPITNYPKNSWISGGERVYCHKNKCKTCVNARTRELYAQNADVIRKQKLEYWHTVLKHKKKN